MTNAKFEDLVKRLEVFARRHPKSYQFLVGAIAILGYAYMIGVVAVAISLLIVTIAGFLAIIQFTNSINRITLGFFFIIIAILIVPIALVLKAIWTALTIKVPLPVGLPLNRKEFPELAQLVDRLAHEIGVKNLKRILLVPEFNASVVQVPKYGAFGFADNYLTIGLPLLQSTSPKQLMAILSHEFGHLSSNHSKFEAWIYRLSIAYSKLLDNSNSQDSSGAIFKVFLNWYVPFLNAYSFVLRRRNEYVADNFAVKIAGISSTADALILIDVYALNLNEQFWSIVYQSVHQESEPPQDVFARLGSFVKEDIEIAKAQDLLERCLLETTNYADTHPCLLDRLKAIGYANHINLPPLTDLTAAEKYLGNSLDSVTQQLNDVWHQSVLPTWQERYQYIQTSKSEMLQLQQKAQNDGLTADEFLQLACWTGEFEETSDAIGMLQHGLVQYPDRADFNYNLALMLLETSEIASAITNLERAMQLEPDYIPSICERLYLLSYRAKDRKIADRCQSIIDRYMESLLAARQERINIDKNDRLEPHNLSTDEIERLCAILGGFLEIKNAYLVRKDVKNFDHKPHYFLIIIYHYSWCKFVDTETVQPILYQNIYSTVKLSASHTLLIFERGNYGNKAGVIRKLKQMPDASIFDRRNR
ncbi:M48 family metalloprotease [Chamaesiphon sp.]|uniref:M48 family metalloprotease n=1 Tax=Chamaesiphon sp. TaxID=2814140 RepID=UPI00359368D7